jgi:hypothetical protein
MERDVVQAEEKGSTCPVQPRKLVTMKNSKLRPFGFSGCPQCSTELEAENKIGETCSLPYRLMRKDR